ncbi:PIG-L family deacetylase [Lentzea sp. BCCO 10_0856]|uniref:PIG-L family deacetylase n=1 Tax=Lentzea miocenica TaxID=3095431 RepID=A0ABU4SY58_9PSEU|nr:PIG-L family deacetylase [Lentzea sp. BCCO 10_0856]MDX8030845.1 PIG-L family deacetylase [Lentzea sp. BCCO 10_0856]
MELSRRKALALGAAATLLPGTAHASAAPPAIFYSPHQDDESLAMAGSIREHKEAGRQVILVLLTRGENGGLLDIMNGAADCPLGQDCPGGGSHGFGLVQDDIVRGRTAEFKAAAQRLGVDRVVIRDRPDAAWGDYAGFVQEVRSTILEFEARYPGASHKLVNGYRDVIYGYPPGDANLTHKACREAAEGLEGQIRDFRYYWVYGYTWPQDQRTADYVLPLSDKQFARKRQALAEYGRWDPRRGRYALGLHSVKFMIDPAAADPHEYIDLPRSLPPGSLRHA